MSSEVLCSFCCTHLNNSEDIFSIIKCGHIYHFKCLQRITYKSHCICTICHAPFDSRQCRKLSLFSKSSNQLYKQKSATSPYEYDWLYCDQKTILDQRELSDYLLKLGTDWKSNEIYAARAFLDKHVLPAFYIPTTKSAIATYGGRALELKDNFDLLDLSLDDKDLYKWAKYENDEVPENAFNILEPSNDLELSEVTSRDTGLPEEKVFIARGEYDGKLLYGKLSSRQNDQSNNFYFAFGSEEIKVPGENNFEVLIRNPF